MNFFDEFKVANCITSQGRTEVFGEKFELAKVVAKLNSRDVVYYIQKGHACTRIVRGLGYVSCGLLGQRGADLIGEPDAIRATLLLPFWIFLSPSEQENEAIDRPSVYMSELSLEYGQTDQ